PLRQPLGRRCNLAAGLDACSRRHRQLTCRRDGEINADHWYFVHLFSSSPPRRCAYRTTTTWSWSRTIPSIGDRGQVETVTTLVMKPRRAEECWRPNFSGIGSVPGRGLDDATYLTRQPKSLKRCSFRQATTGNRSTGSRRRIVGFRNSDGLRTTY